MSTETDFWGARASQWAREGAANGLPVRIGPAPDYDGIGKHTPLGSEVSRCPVGLFAEADFEPGDLIFMEEPLCSTPLFSTEGPSDQRCMHCLRLLEAANEPSACESCGAVYCCAECRETAEVLYHGLLCNARSGWAQFEAHAEECDNEYYVLAAKMLAEVVASQEQGAEFKFPWCGFKSVDWWHTIEPVLSDELNLSDVEAYRESFKTAIREQTNVTCELLQASVQGLSPFLSTHVLSKCIGLLRMNLQAIWLPGSDPVREPFKAMGLFALQSTINHSCSPNIYMCHSDGDERAQATVRALKYISAGEQLLHDYLNTDEQCSQQERRAMLQEQYQFGCKCDKCGEIVMNS